MSELLPCPFCGGEAELHPTYDMDTSEVDGWFVWCNNKECECAPETREHFTEAEAIAAWNTRAERTCENIDKYASDGFFICGNCGFGDNAIELTPNYCPNCGAKVVGE